MATIPASVLHFVHEASSSAGAEGLFWESDQEGVPEEGMYQLALELDLDDPETLLDGLPAGYAIVLAVFLWEQSRAGEGFVTGVKNSGEALVEKAAASYEQVGMRQEAVALRAMLAQLAHTPEDHEAVQSAYLAVENPYKDDWNRIPFITRHLSMKAHEYFYEGA